MTELGTEMWIKEALNRKIRAVSLKGTQLSKMLGEQSKLFAKIYYHTQHHLVKSKHVHSNRV